MQIFVIGSYVQACCWFVDSIPKPSETLTATGLHIEAGGKGLNVAVCAHRLGADVDAMFGIGDDVAGRELIDLLSHEGISTQHSHVLAKQSGYGAGMIAKSGQNAIAVYPGPNLLLDASHVALAQTSIAHSQLVYGQFEGAYEAVLASFTCAKQHGVKTVLNPSPWQAISSALLQCTDVMIVNEVEVLDLLKIADDLKTQLRCDVTTLIDWEDFLSNYVDQLWNHWQGEILVVTLGHLGCIAFQKSTGEAPVCTVVPAFYVKAVDTVGCGDAFASGFCTQFLTHSLTQTLMFANACGALVAQKEGVLDALPNLSDVENFLEQHT
ncbi:MAG: ribokinase [Methylotenera sp.]|nr:ribokinase [Methylotenera sp.]